MGARAADAAPPVAARRLRVAFVHPDLGLGGAERLVVDAATELAERGHEVTIYTPFHDPDRCFPETTSGAFRVLVAGGALPRSLGGRCTAACAYARCAAAALRLVADSRASAAPYDVVFADQVSAVVPVLQWAGGLKVLFYCHFPDQLLARRGGRLRAAYRYPIDALECATTGAADGLLVNSRFTAAVFASTFPSLAARGVVPRVLYPAAAVPGDDALASARAGWRAALPPAVADLMAAAGDAAFVSINRFERKKGIPLALRALAEVLRAAAPASPAAAACLVMAGGYDPRLEENVEHLKELRALAAELGVEDRVAFLPSFSEALREALLAAAAAIIYTPENEHFGIVPIEAGAAGVPVLAVASGGPLESVVDGETGWLLPPQASAFAAAMAAVATDPGLRARVGAAARTRASAMFSRPAFGAALEAELLTTAGLEAGGRGERGVRDGGGAAAARGTKAD